MSTYSSSNPIDPTELTKLLVFGTNSPSSPDYNSHIRPIGSSTPSITYSMSDYMTTGGGRYAYPSLFSAVEKFFNYGNLIEPGTYEYTTTGGTITGGSGLGFLGNDDFTATVYQYVNGIGSDDYAERSYIFGTGGFAIKNIQFDVSQIDGKRSIITMEVKALRDNFDFNSGNAAVQTFNNTFSKPILDPYDLSLNREPVFINFDTSEGKNYYNYDFGSFFSHQLTEIIDFNGGFNLSLIQPYLDSIASDPFLSYKRGDLQVIYGTPGDENLNRFSVKPFPHFVPLSGYLIVGGTGNDTLKGDLFADEIQAGDGNDYGEGGSNYDKFYGGTGN
ncbi:hypothetical protein QUB35_34000, partial [Microcoleus sp. B13-B6]